MRINRFIAQATNLSRRAVDQAIGQGRVTVNGLAADLGRQVQPGDQVTLDKRTITPPVNTTTIMLNKPVGSVCSRRGQGSATIYDLLPVEYHHLNPIGRLDKDSSGLLLLTSDGVLANRLTHPRYGKTKIYEVTLDKPLAATDQTTLEQGIKIDDYVSHLKLSKIKDRSWRVTMSEGKNRQIRRTFAALGYTVTTLHRTHFGDYRLDGLPNGKFQLLP